MRTEYIRQQIPEPPAPPGYYPVRFVKKDGHYCTSDDESARNLLKNRVLDKGYQAEISDTLEGLKEGDR